jgi:hypothetical protein
VPRRKVWTRRAPRWSRLRRSCKDEVL